MHRPIFVKRQPATNRFAQHSNLFNWAIPNLFFAYFLSFLYSLFGTDDSKQILPMAGFEQHINGVGSDHSTNEE